MLWYYEIAGHLKVPKSGLRAQTHGPGVTKVTTNPPRKEGHTPYAKSSLGNLLDTYYFGFRMGAYFDAIFNVWYLTPAHCSPQGDVYMGLSFVLTWTLTPSKWPPSDTSVSRLHSYLGDVDRADP